MALVQVNYLFKVLFRTVPVLVSGNMAKDF